MIKEQQISLILKKGLSFEYDHEDVYTTTYVKETNKIKRMLQTSDC